MAQIKNISGEQLIVPWLGGRLVQKGQTVEVDDDLVYAYTQQGSNWAPVGEETEGLHEAAAIAAEADQLVVNGGAVAEPPGNASRVEWGAYVVATGLATAEEVVELNRDEIRDTYELPPMPAGIPGGNARRDEWAAYAVGSGQATAEDVAGMGRNDLRAAYGEHDDETPAPVDPATDEGEAPDEQDPETPVELDGDQQADTSDDVAADTTQED